MSYRIKGKEMAERLVHEQTCDQCHKVIPEGQYPEITLELTHSPLEGSMDLLDFCSWMCIITYAQAQANT